MNPLISLFIDDEMELDEKICFVHEVRGSSCFAEDAIELLQMQKQIRGEVVERIPSLETTRPTVFEKIFSFFIKPLGWVSTALAAAVVTLVVITMTQPASVPLSKNRFVIYMPQVNQVEIAGSFTNWERIPMQRAGGSGYWEVHLALPAGEHQFAYIVDGRRRLADPTIRMREKDDFGGYNSILHVNGEA